MKTVKHCLMPGHTISAVIRRYNRYVTGEDYAELREEFTRLNGNQIWRAGMTVMVPILPEKAGQ